MNFFERLLLKIYFATKIPMIFFCKPKIIKSSTEKVVVKIPFMRRNKNHLGSMYFGALSVGADLSAGLLAVNCIRRKKSKAKLVFKDFTADFLKRPLSDVYFEATNKDSSIDKLVEENINSAKRVSFPINVKAICDNEIVATFTLTTSIK